MERQTADQAERRAMQENPARYNQRNPWPKVDKFASELRKEVPIDLMPEEDYSDRAIAERELVEGQIEGQNVLQFLQYAKNPQLAAERESGATQAAMRKLGSDFWNEQAQKTIRDSIARRVDRRVVRKLENYPTILDALVQAQANGEPVDEDDVARLVDYVAANEAAEMILSTSDPIRQQNILKTANPIMRAAIGDIIAERLLEVGKSVEEGEGNVLINALGTAGSLVLEPFQYAWERTQQSLRFATQVNPFTPPTERQNVLPWGAFVEGNFRQPEIDKLKAEYDPLAVDIMLDIAKAYANQAEDHVGEVMAMDKYATNEAGMIFRRLLYAADSNPELMELARKIDEANLGTTGPVLFNSFFGDLGTGTVWRERASGALSIGAGFIDPTIFAGRAINAFRGVKYALNKIAPGQDVAVAFASKTVLGKETNTARIYFDNLIKDMRTVDEIADAGEKARRRALVSRQYREVPDEVITEIGVQKFKTVDDFAQFINEANEANILLRGGITPQANRAAQSIFAEKNLYERLYTTLPQTRQAMLPRMSLGRFLRAQGAAAISATVMPRKRSKEVIERFYGPGANADDVSRIMFENGLDIGAADQARSLALRGNVGRGIDRFFQKFASLPNKGFITTSDASDSRTFYAFARTFLTKYHATYLTDVFRAANPGQRRLLIAGLVRSAAASRGVDFSKETILHRIDDLTTGYTADELYSAARTEVLTPGGLKPLGALTPEEQGDVIGQIDDLIVVRPSNVNGKEHALHLWQTADGVAIPHIKDIEDLKTYRQLVPEWIQPFTTNLPQNITDMWSLGTLYGWRFSQRSAIEDYWAYVVTSGRLDYLYKGRKAAMALREARPNIKIVAKDGKNEVIVNSRLGMFAKRFRKVGDKVKAKEDYASPSLTSQILSVAFLENLDEADVVAANIAFKNGDADALKALYLKSMGRYRLSGLTDQNMEDLADLVDTSYGLKQIDEVSEQGALLNSGAMPNPNLSVPGSDLPGIKTFEIPNDARTVLGNFVDVPKGSKNYNLFWFNAIHGTAELDGPIGKIAIADIYNKDRAIERIADVIRKDTKFGYKERLSMIYTGDVSIDEFARRYYEDVRNIFSNKDGKINKKLVDLIAPVGDDGFRVVDIYRVDDAGETVMKVSPAAMRDYADDAPEFVLGRNEIPMPQSEANLIDKGFNILGEQYNRISKEPIVTANYLEQRDLLRGYEQQLAGLVGEKAARNIVKNMSLDRAIGFTLSYTDNPANRSQLAWKVRNFSRYYRATEDFYRRAFRIAKNYPVAFWKTALTYQLLDDTGMIMEDDNGNKYFAYPGSDLLQAATRSTFSWLFGDNIHLDLKPSFLGGQVNMLAPSSDINQITPAPTGPVGVIPVKLLFSKFPEIQRFERYVLGEYAAQGSWYDSIIPGQAARVLRAMSSDERYSFYGSAVMDAVAIAVAEDLLPGDLDNVDKISRSDELQGIRNIAWGTVITKLLMGFAVPASPQTYSETVTDYARENGLESMRSAFLELVRAYDGDIKKAYRQWWRLNKDGDLMPFTVSRTEVSRDTVASFADVQPVMGLEKWYTDNSALYKKYPNASLLLAPKTGEFSFDSWNVLTKTLGIRTPKNVNQFMLDALSAKTQYQYMATLADYRKDIDLLDPRNDEDRKRITELEEQRSEDVKWLESIDPFWAQNRAENSNRMQAENYAKTMYTEAKQMVNELKETGKADDVSSSIRSAIYTYEDYMTDIKMITGNTEAERDQKRQLRFEMERDLQIIAERNENVKSFIENVLYWEPDVGEF